MTGKEKLQELYSYLYKYEKASLNEVLNNSNREKDVFIIDFTPSEKSQSIKIEPQNMQRK